MMNMLIQALPNDILKEVIAAVDPATTDGRSSLQTFRLVSRAASAFATPILFRNFETFHLVYDRDDAIQQVRTLGCSELRHRVRSLGIPVRYLDFNHRIWLLPDFSDLMHELTVSFGNDFRFQGLQLGRDANMPAVVNPSPPAPRNDDGSSHRRAEGIVSWLHTHDIFSEVSFVQAYFRDSTICLFPGVSSGISRFAASIRDIDIEIRNSLAGYWKIFGNSLRSGFPILCRLTLRYTTGRFLVPLFSPEDDQNWVIPNLRYLCIIGGFMDWDPYESIYTTLVRLPNVSELQIIHCAISDRGEVFWCKIFTGLPATLLNLTTIFFEGLAYADPGTEENVGDRIKAADTTMCRYTPCGPGDASFSPIITPYSEDIDALKELLGILNQRRNTNGMGLENDNWMTGFGSQ